MVVNSSSGSASTSWQSNIAWGADGPAASPGTESWGSGTGAGKTSGGGGGAGKTSGTEAWGGNGGAGKTSGTEAFGGNGGAGKLDIIV